MSASGVAKPSARRSTTVPAAGISGTMENTSPDGADHVATAQQPASLCRNGHPRTPENTYTGPSGRQECQPCRILRGRERRATQDVAARRAYNREYMRRRPEARYRYSHSAKNRAGQARYRATTKGWESQRRFELKGARERIATQLDALEEKEREACRRLQAVLTPTKFGELAQSTLRSSEQSVG